MVCKMTKVETIHSQCDTFSIHVAVSVLVSNEFVVVNDMVLRVEVLAVADIVALVVDVDTLWMPMCDSTTCLVSSSQSLYANVAWRLGVEWICGVIVEQDDACTDGSLYSWTNDLCLYSWLDSVSDNDGVAAADALDVVDDDCNCEQ